MYSETRHWMKVSGRCFTAKKRTPEHSPNRKLSGSAQKIEYRDTGTGFMSQSPVKILVKIKTASRFAKPAM
jgi:hypothetical protein